MSELTALEAEITACRRCPRLVEWRERVARERRASYKDETYWGRPVPGFGDPDAGVVVFGLAPAAHGANRTGRFFTGDRSGDFLFASLYRTGFASQPSSTSIDDGLKLRGAWVSAAVRCAPPENKPTRQERDTCLPYAARELRLLDAKVVVCLGGFAWDAATKLLAVSPRPKFGHGELFETDGKSLLGCYHPSQQNTFTGRLRPQMMDDVFGLAARLAGGRANSGRT